MKRLQCALHVLRTRKLADHEMRHVARERLVYPGKDESKGDGMVDEVCRTERKRPVGPCLCSYCQAILHSGCNPASRRVKRKSVEFCCCYTEGAMASMQVTVDLSYSAGALCTNP